MVADVLAMQGARASAVMILTKLKWDNSVPARYGLKSFEITAASAVAQWLKHKLSALSFLYLTCTSPSKAHSLRWRPGSEEQWEETDHETGEVRQKMRCISCNGQTAGQDTTWWKKTELLSPVATNTIMSQIKLLV